MHDPESVSTHQFLQKFPDEEAARKFFEAKRWGDGPVCGHCGSANVVEVKNHKPMPYRCRDCRKHFSVRTGTVLGESRLPLLTWLLAIDLLTREGRGMPIGQISRELGVTQKTARVLMQRIRDTYLNDRGDRVVERQLA